MLYEKCYSDKDVNDQECKDFCKKDLRIYEFPFKNLFRNLKYSLKVVYNALVDKDIEEFYSEIKEEEFDLEEDDLIEFYEKNNEWQTSSMDNVEWGFDQDEGFNVFKQIMEKKYINKKYQSTFVLNITNAVIGFIIVNLF